MEHGVLGEARAKAFLLEQFWVLERSVDIQGSDYLIQRRLTSLNFMDESPPKLGIVQVKFVQDGSTYISIDKEYVCSESGTPYEEFFLLIFTGTANSSRSFLLSSRDVIKTFAEKAMDDRIYMKVKASRILDSKNYEILDRAGALDRMDHALKNADFLRNRRFLSGTSYVKISPDHIDHDLLLPLDNSYADFEKEFFKDKKRLQSVLFEMEDVVESMQKMLRATDPEIAFSIYEDAIAPHVGTSHGIVFSADYFNDEDFLSAVQHHKSRLEAIRKLELESSFFALLGLVESEIAKQVANLQPRKHQKVMISVTYDSDTLGNAAVRVKRSKSEISCPRVVKSERGCHTIEFLPWSWIPFDVLSGEVKPAKESDDLQIQYQASSWQYRRPFQGEIEKYLIGEELASQWMW